MKINVRVTPGAKKNSVSDSDSVRVWTTARATDGHANTAVVKLLATHFGVAKSRVKIVRGATGRDKVVEILE
ncbi:MAG: DUF167 domain-containing protein [Rickettsiales bacterium]|jgi:uncharacterized protein (TIGR00251 family)|nr:DUF167 domain-containing protein [Rickettsiales bacterium]